MSNIHYTPPVRQEMKTEMKTETSKMKTFAQYNELQAEPLDLSMKCRQETTLEVLAASVETPNQQHHVLSTEDYSSQRSLSSPQEREDCSESTISMTSGGANTEHECESGRKRSAQNDSGGSVPRPRYCVLAAETSRNMEQKPENIRRLRHNASDISNVDNNIDKLTGQKDISGKHVCSSVVGLSNNPTFVTTLSEMEYQEINVSDAKQVSLNLSIDIEATTQHSARDDISESVHYSDTRIDASMEHRNVSLTGPPQQQAEPHGEEREVKRFQCKYPPCKYSTQWTNALRAHERVHTGERPYVCDIGSCRKAFVQLTNLIVHKRSHTGERPYACDIGNCKKRFKSSSNLTEHMKTHSEERPYECDFVNCEMHFKTLSNLIAHKRIHSDEKPYRCDFNNCEMRFELPKQLTRHKKSHREETE